MKSKPKTIDEYLAALSDDKLAVLGKLRKTIRAAAPKAEECISYRLPAFRLNGRVLVAFGATASPVRPGPACECRQTIGTRRS
jgi:uncharacterized protein YdhG (YjbR/CyaY superfamily)